METARPWRTSGAQEPRRPVVDEPRSQERQPQPDRVGDEQDRALRDGRRSSTAIVRMPPRIMPMHGVQPIAKIAPRPNDASQPPRLADEPAAEPVADRSARPSAAEAIVPVVAAHGGRRAGVEWPPGSLERRHRAGRRRGSARGRSRITPPTWRRAGIHCDEPAAANVAVTPSSVNTAPNPAT